MVTLREITKESAVQNKTKNQNKVKEPNGIIQMLGGFFNV